ncbi:MAG: HAD-IIA family hydrolase [Clostridiales bacterium]|nr:HAD-IIA family hydrolase [Clostridiales bacterium]
MLKDIKDTKVLMLDLDGTVYIDGVLIGDVKNTLQGFRDMGVKIVYLTNNSSRTDAEYVKRLKAVDIFEPNDMVYSSLDCAIDYIKANYPSKTVYPVAMPSAVEELKSHGIKVVPDNADILFLAFDRELNYEKIVKANEHMVNGAIYIATHPDLTCPAPGVSIPDLGSMMKMFKASSGRDADIITGKPFSVMADCIMKRFGVEKRNITMVGDRLATDIKFGVDSNINSVLVLTGDTDIETANKSDIKPDLVLDNIDQLKEYIK